jgi:hypothetical protein
MGHEQHRGLEYILVRELTHLLGHQHKERFTGLRTLREELTGSLLTEL